MISTTIIVIFALFIVGIVGAVTNKSMKKQLEDNFAVLSNALKKDIENIDNSLKSFCEYIYINDNIAGDIFASNPEPQKVYSNLRTIYTSSLSFNSNIDSIQCYNSYNGVLYSIGTNMDTNESQLADILSEADSIAANTMLVRKMKYFLNLQKYEKAVFSYFVYESGKISQNSSFLAINLKSDWLLDSLDKYSGVYDDNIFAIFDTDNDFFLYNNQALENNQNSIIEAVASNSKYININNKKHILYATVLEGSNLTVCSLFPYEKVYAEKNRFTLVILVSSLLIVILGIILSFFMARKIYMPFGKLYNEIAENDVNINELENIKMIFHKNNETLQNYERQIRDESKVVKRNAINRLLNSSEELSESEIEKIFSYLSISMTQNFIVAVLCVDCIDGKNIYNDPLITYALYNIALEVIRGKYKAEGEQILGNRVAVIINVPDGKDFFAKIYKIMQGIIKHMVDNFDVSISVSISEPVQRIDELSAAVLAAKQNLLYRFNYGYGKFFTEQTVSINKNNTRQTFSAAYEELLIGSTEERDKIDGLKKIIDEIRSMNYLNSFIECLRLSNILRDKLKLDVELALDNNISNFAINQTLDEFYNEACEKLSKKYMNSGEKMEEDTKTLHIVSEAKAYIEKNFSNSDANIVRLSEELKISQRKLSEMFRKETGMSFVAYLTRFRIDKAKEYILDDKFDIKEISSMVGISNPTYFYKLFKSQCDVTPTQYKKIFGSDRSK